MEACRSGDGDGPGAGIYEKITTRVPQPSLSQVHHVTYPLMQTTTLIAGSRHDDVTAPLVIDDPMDGQVLLA